MSNRVILDITDIVLAQSGIDAKRMVPSLRAVLSPEDTRYIVDNPFRVVSREDTGSLLVPVYTIRSIEEFEGDSNSVIITASPLGNQPSSKVERVLLLTLQSARPLAFKINKSALATLKLFSESAPNQSTLDIFGAPSMREVPSAILSLSFPPMSSKETWDSLYASLIEITSGNFAHNENSLSPAGLSRIDQTAREAVYRLLVNMQNGEGEEAIAEFINEYREAFPVTPFEGEILMPDTMAQADMSSSLAKFAVIAHEFMREQAEQVAEELELGAEELNEGVGSAYDEDFDSIVNFNYANESLPEGASTSTGIPTDVTTWAGRLEPYKNDVPFNLIPVMEYVSMEDPDLAEIACLDFLQNKDALEYLTKNYPDNPYKGTLILLLQAAYYLNYISETAGAIREVSAFVAVSNALTSDKEVDTRYGWEIEAYLPDLVDHRYDRFAAFLDAEFYAGVEEGTDRVLVFKPYLSAFLTTLTNDSPRLSQKIALKLQSVSPQSGNPNNMRVLKGGDSKTLIADCLEVISEHVAEETFDPDPIVVDRGRYYFFRNLLRNVAITYGKITLSDFT